MGAGCGAQGRCRTPADNSAASPLNRGFMKNPPMAGVPVRDVLVWPDYPHAPVNKG